MAIVLGGCALVLAWDYINTKPYVHPQFVAEPYVPPKGCSIRSYELFDDIAESCANGKYLFRAWREYGLRSTGKGGAYYRVGNDLIGINCNYGKCSVRQVEKDVFVNNNGSSKIK